MKGLELRKLIVNIGETLGIQVFSALLSLLTVVLIARVYGPVGNGSYAMALLLPNMLFTFLNLGLTSANVYFLSSNQITIRDLLKVNVRIFIMISSVGLVIGCWILVWGAQSIFPGVPESVLWLALLAFPIYLLNSYLHSFFQGLQNFRIYNLLLAMHPLILIIFVSGLSLHSNRDLGYLIGAQLLSQLTVLCSTIYLILQITGPKFNSNPNSQAVKKTLSYGWKAQLANIISFINYKADIFLVNFFMGPASVGLYFIAVAIAEKLWLLSQAVSTVLLPRLSQLNKDEHKRKMLTPIVARWVLLSTFIGSLFLAASAKPMISWLFGIDYVESILPLLILLPGITALSFARVLANDIAARGHPEWNMYSSIIVLIVNIFGNLILIPLYGLAGAAISTSSSYILMLIFLIYVYARVSENKWMDLIYIKYDDLRMLREIFFRH